MRSMPAPMTRSSFERSAGVGPNMLPLVFSHTRAPLPLANSIMSTMCGWSILSAVPRDHFPDGCDDVVGIAVRHLRVERKRNRPVGVVLGVREVAATEPERLLVIGVKVHGAEVHADADVLGLDGVHDDVAIRDKHLAAHDDRIQVIGV